MRPLTRGALRAAVIARDGQCVIAYLVPDHRCRDQWGQPMHPSDPAGLTLGHVREHPGGRRRDEARWCIAQCFGSNLEHAESAHAEAVRAYLAAL